MSRKHEGEILLVEDDPNDLELALIVLRQHDLGDRVQVARDGEEALDILFNRGHEGRGSEHRPKVILLDLKLPKITGFEVLKELKANPRTRPIPVAIMTSSKQQRDMWECYEMGANSYIQKPIDFAEFRRVVGDLAHYWLTVNQSLPVDGYLPSVSTAEPEA